MADMSRPVAVGIDGSTAAIRAMLWAVDEAVIRNLALRLVHVLPTRGPDNCGETVEPEVEYGQTALRSACAAVEANGKQVKIDTAVLHGDVVDVLVDESCEAGMICVGSVGIGQIASAVLGSTATALAERAHCPVAIVRSGVGAAKLAQPPDSYAGENQPWIAVAVEEEPGNDAVMHAAMEQARLRHAPILALRVTPWQPGSVPYDHIDRRLHRWAHRYPDVFVLPVTAGGSFEHYLDTYDEPIQLAVVGTHHAGHLAQLLGPHRDSILPHPGCSVLVVGQ
jgi:nucleotide-binding universal stress UspA family protein